METSISALCGSLAEVLLHAESSSRALTDAVSQPPIHLDSATTALLRKLEGLTDAAAAYLERLDSMTFAELLGHCDEALKVYERHADAVQTRLTVN